MKICLCAVTAAVLMIFIVSGLEDAHAEGVDIQLPVSVFQRAKPQITDSVLYYIGMDSSLYALDLSGIVKWNSEYLTGDRFSPLTVDNDGDVYFIAASDSGGELILYCVGHDNSDFWQVSLGGADGGTLRAPVIDDESVLVLSGGQLFLVNKKTKSFVNRDPFPWWYTVSEGKNQSNVGMLVGRDRIKLFLNENTDSTGSPPPPIDFNFGAGPKIGPPSNIQIDH